MEKADLEALRGIPGARAKLDAEELALIDRARRDGATWSEIASALGLGTRQAAEQRRLRLATATSRSRQQEIDLPYGARVVALRAAAADLHRRVGADRRWDGRFGRATLVRETLAATEDAPPGSLFSLIAVILGDLDRVEGLPFALQNSVWGLRQAFTEATPAS